MHGIDSKRIIGVLMYVSNECKNDLQSSFGGFDNFQ